MYSKDAIQRRARQIAERHAAKVKAMPQTVKTGVKFLEDDPLYKEWQELDRTLRDEQPYYLRNSEQTYNDIAKPILDGGFYSQLREQCKKHQARLAQYIEKLEAMQKKFEAADKNDEEYPGTTHYEQPIFEIKGAIESMKDAIEAFQKALVAIRPAEDAVDSLGSAFARVTGMDGRAY